MGGCRCSYRNCTVKSDGVVHMFHYPVFDKVRCHRWLTNAQRLEFLNLKVSQLKNRTVCQHHFQPECFMNFKRDKLRYDAVPTENGPFCNAKDWAIQELTTILPIVPDEIENDRLTYKEKKNKYTVKYGDFLTNSDTDPNDHSKYSFDSSNFLLGDSNNQESQVKNITSNAIIELEIPPKYKMENIRMSEPSISCSNKEPVKNNRVKIISEKKISAPVELKGKLEPVPHNLLICVRNKKTNDENQVKPVVPEEELIKPAVPEKELITLEDIENMNVIYQNPQENFVDMSNTKISFFPQIFIEPQNIPNTNQNFVEVQHNSVYYTETPNLNVENITGNSVTIPVKSEDIKTTNENTTPIKRANSKASDQASPKQSLLKNKIPPERVAAIEEKRKFNKKLRDMIEFCLDDIETPEKTASDKSQNVSNKPQSCEEIKNVNISKPKKQIKEPLPKKLQVTHNSEKQVVTLEDVKNEICAQQVTSYLCKEPSLPSKEAYDTAALAARLKNMEDILLQKIEQNTQRIVDLRSTMERQAVEKRSVFTQTKDDEETHKRQLFQEISVFLSPQANSLIYEELFLNKFVKNSHGKSVSAAAKRRKLR